MGTTGIRHGECESKICSGRHTYLTQPTHGDYDPVAEAEAITAQAVAQDIEDIIFVSGPRELALA